MSFFAPCLAQLRESCLNRFEPCFKANLRGPPLALYLSKTLLKGDIMKAFLLITLLGSTAFSQEYTFVTPGNDKKMEFKAQSSDADQAFKAASQQCFDFFTKGKQINREYGLTVIDVCANLRKK